MRKKEDIVPSKSELILYQTEDGKTRIDVRLQDETVWLTQKLMAELFQKDIRTINENLKNIFAEGELVPESVIRNFRITASDGKKYDTANYLLDQQLRSLEKHFVEEGGFTERLYRVRSQARKSHGGK